MIPALIVVAVIAAFLILVATRPSEFRVERTATIAAPAAVVFAEVNDFRRWAAWSPWDKMDPSMKRSYEGSPSGTGAVYAWDGNSKVGSGRMTIAESRPAESIRIRLEFFKPMAGVSPVEFTFNSEGGRTVVTWSMSGTHKFVAKIFCLFMSMDKMVGGSYAQGLASLKSISEAAARK